MKPLPLRCVRMRLHPAMAAHGSVATKMNNVLRGPGTSLAALNPMMKAVGLPATPLTQTFRPGRNQFAAPTLRRDRPQLR